MKFPASRIQEPQGKKDVGVFLHSLLKGYCTLTKVEPMLVGVLKASLHLQYKKKQTEYRQVSKKNGDFATRKNTPNAQPVYQSILATSKKKESENGNIHVSERATKNLAC